MNLMKTTSNQCEIQIAFISDIHLAHPRTSTHHIIQNLRKAFPDNDQTGKIDILFFAGDVFDRLMNLPQEEVDEIQEWIADLLKICVKRDVMVRVLEGTPSHDWRQSKQFVNINETLSVKADLRYWDVLGVEVFEKFNGLSVLYVPDEWNADASDTFRQVKELLSLHGMDQVDVACMHGSFDYQLPIESVKNHNSEHYMSIVRHYIGIGHVHIRTERGKKILAQGSFDRLSHGEEAPKGHYRACISQAGNYHWFVENTGARIYRTLDCRTLEVDETIELMTKNENEPNESSFRLLVQRGSAVHHGLKDLRKRFPQFRITTQMDELKSQEDVQLAEHQSPIVKPISITSTNISHLVSERMMRQGVDPTAQRSVNILAVLDKYKVAG